MKKINYRITVNINEQIMKLGFRGQLPSEHQDKKIRVQAIFSQRLVDRRFPMEVCIEDTDIGPQIRADAEIELPYVFMTPPRRRVTITFALWCGMEEILLDDQPFPVQKELFARSDAGYQPSKARFAALTAGLPLLLARSYLSEGKDMEKAKKKANDYVYKNSGISYSPRQQHTNYFADRYRKEVQRNTPLTGNRVLFLSERLPEEGGNLQRIRKMFEADPDVEVTEFINTSTIDALSREEIRKCARLCAQARAIILEDFYPQLHSLTVRPETRVVQLWHACGAFKTFGLSRMGKQGGAPQSSMNHRNYDFVSVSSERLRGIYAEAFAVPYHKIAALGVPRTDDLFDWQYKKNKREELYNRYPLLREGKAVLFAPTFRGDGNKDAYYPEDAFDVRLFMDEMPEDVVLIIKHHPFVKQPVIIPEEYSDRILDLTGKDHIDDLMLVADLLITDYSSCIFEASILELPMLFYAFDEEDYIRNRDFYFDYEQLAPGPVEHTMEGLIRAALKLLGQGGEDMEDEKEETFASCTEEAEDRDTLSRREEKFREVFLAALDGHSTERIYRYIRDHFLEKSGKPGKITELAKKETEEGL